jgi:hypothetical protein
VQRCRKLHEKPDHVYAIPPFPVLDSTRKYRDLIPRIKRQENGQGASRFLV